MNTHTRRLIIALTIVTLITIGLFLTPDILSMFSAEDIDRPSRPGWHISDVSCTNDPATIQLNTTYGLEEVATSTPLNITLTGPPPTSPQISIQVPVNMIERQNTTQPIHFTPALTNITTTMTNHTGTTPNLIISPITTDYLPTLTLTLPTPHPTNITITGHEALTGTRQLQCP